MKVLKRDGTHQAICFDKILKRISGAAVRVVPDLLQPGTRAGDSLLVSADTVALKTINGIFDGIETQELDELAANKAIHLSLDHPHYGVLASNLIVSNHHKNTSSSLAEVYDRMFAQGLVTSVLHRFVGVWGTRLDRDVLDFSRDYHLDYFGFKTMENSYLIRDRESKLIIERPQHMWLRVAMGIHVTADNIVSEETLVDVATTYYLLSNKYFTHATPTLFNAGTSRPQLSSCFLMGTEDSLEGIFKTVVDTARISKWAGGIGLHVSDIRSEGSPIRGTNGKSNGIVPMTRTYNEVARFINQGSKRPGAFALYLEPWHDDIFSFLHLRKNQGDENMRARDLYYAVYLNDLFMERLADNGSWSLMCPDECPGLTVVHGDAFRALYITYERQGKYRRQVPARDIWREIIASQVETGMPYLLNKDSINRRSNQQNLGTIRSSNLCAEIALYSDDKEYAVCNLASIALARFVDVEKQTFDHDMLFQVTRVVVRNLNKVIDINFYPVPETRLSNMRHRPIGIGVQGLADTFALLRMPFGSEGSRTLDRKIFETIYYAAVYESNRLAIRDSAYETFPGSPASKGVLQIDMWDDVELSSRWDWESLRKSVVQHGLRNSELTALMPTASTSTLFGFNEAFEPFVGNIYKRRTSAGEFIVFNRYMVNNLIDRGLWSPDLKNEIIRNNGNLGTIESIPLDLRQLHITAWEMSQKNIIEMSRNRSPFVSQTQSMNLYIAKPSYPVISSMHRYSWRIGLKTMQYYLRTMPKVDAVKITSAQRTAVVEEEEDDDCLLCGS